MNIQVKNLRKTYNNTAVLEDLSFTAGPGVTCVMGPSGAGKTTLLRLLMGLEKPDGGVILGADCRWSAVFQEDRLLESLDAAGNLRFVLGRDFDSRAAALLLEELGLGDAGGKIAGEYSGGMKRRLSLARALLSPWDALALDEPFSGLDSVSRERAAECIRRYGRGRPVLAVTHDPGDMEALEAVQAVYLG